ncbi:MAG: DNA mismatch repair protein MutS [Bryobacterales bacterium]|nr:DNA mismatch repair protein MutS [Bryobacteraceae bacterium]MDW8129702.1 DNA mismatch repair protein MutS [Bryobacterales bacterium]
MSSEGATPLMRQYHAIKRQVPGALLMFRLGDFYELFYEDAVTAARELGITLTSRNKESGQPIPMCGVPYHAAESYIARLVARGYRVALCDQMEDPRKARKLVRREITRIVTPGTATETELLRSRENHYLAAVLRERDRAGLAWVDVSTGEFRASETPAEELKEALETLSPREILLPAGAGGPPGETSTSAARTEREPWTFDPEHGERLLCEQFGLLNLDGLGLRGRRVAVGAAGAILEYLRETQRAALEHLEAPRYFDRETAMRLDAVTVRNLEILEPLFPPEMGGLEDASLLGVIDATRTGMGGRLLRSRLLRPSLDLAEIEARLDAVEELVSETVRRGELRKELEAMADLERLLARLTLGTAGPREMLALGRSLERIPRLKELLGEPRCARLRELGERMDELADLRDRILAAIHPDPPATLADGGAIRDGYHPELDALRDVSRNSRRYLAQIEQRERTRTGIASLKVRFNNVFGYYLEVSKANLHLVPPDYERKQTLVGAERFTTPELKELEAKILAAEEKILELEKEIFGELRSFAASRAARIRATAAAIAELDVTAALAEVAHLYGYRRPRFSGSGRMLIRDGRHPVIEMLCRREGTRYIPNDVYLDPQGDFIAVITGPNMGGKSTYLRQVALIAILAQMGSFVPAAEAELPLVDRVFTRIGASDNLARGRSTFMVEMTETAEILNLATPRSLILLDEVGRGTATFDGLALAWAVVEYIHDRIRAKTLFATHYHELTELADQLPGVRNLRVSVKESGDQIVFLRKVEPGAADRSYGIEVARLAGLPREVIERARQVLALHERSEHSVTEVLSPRPEPASSPVQIRLFEPVSHQIAERIRRLNLDELRPIEALRLLAELQEELKREL